jgi:hypothetical protein
MRSRAERWRRGAGYRAESGMRWIRRHRAYTITVGLVCILLGMLLTVLGQRSSFG